MKIVRWFKPSVSIAVAMQLLITIPVIAGPVTNSGVRKLNASKFSLAGDLIELKSMTLQWEGANPIRVIRIPLISGKSIAANYLIGKIPFFGGGSSKSSFVQIRKVISTEEAARMSSPEWSLEQEIETHLSKNPFVNENALLLLEQGEEIRFEMSAAKSVGVKMGAGLGVVPVGGSANLSEGQRFVFVIRKLSGSQVQLDVTRMDQVTKGTKANVGSGFTFLADSDAAVAKGLNFRDFYTNVYMNLIQNVKNKGVTDSYVLDLNSEQEVQLFKDAVIKKVTKKTDGPVKSGDDLRVLEESFMDSLEESAQKISSDVHTGRSFIESETSSLNRNAGLESMFGKFLYSMKFSRNFVKIENANIGGLGILQFYQTEAAMVGAKRSFWDNKNGRLSKMGITFSTKGDYANPEVDKLLEFSITSTRYTYAKDNQDQLKQWKEYFIDFLPESFFNQVFSGDWDAEARKPLLDPRLSSSVYFNRDYLVEISTKASQNPDGPQPYFEKMLESYIKNANGKNVGQVSKRNKFWEATYQFFVDRFGRENEGFIDAKSPKISKQIQEIAATLTQVVDSETSPLKRIEAFESLRKSALFKRISTGFLVSLVEPHDLHRFVTIEMNRAHDELVEKAGKAVKEHRYQEFKVGPERNPDIKTINGLINRAKGGSTSLAVPPSGEADETHPICAKVFAA